MRPTMLLAALVTLTAPPWAVSAAAAVPASPLDDAALTAEIDALKRLDRRVVHVGTLASTRAGRAVPHVELGSGSESERDARPALLVVAGTEEHDLVGTAAVLRLARDLLAARAEGGGAERAELLDRVTVHLVPRLSPEAAAAFFASPRRESARSGLPVDDDHDGLTDEDGPEDLDGDGLVTWMRVEDPEGDLVLDPEEPRLLREPRREKGERPGWRLLPEGRDDDGDERWNEDGRGGVNLNRSFPFGYEWFAADSGVHQLNEPAARALADLVVAHPNISVVVAYGAADNVAGQPKPAKKREGPAPRWGRKPPTAMDPDDHAWLKQLGEEHREAVGLSKALEAVTKPGSLADWAYYHRGLLGLAVAPWRPEVAAALERKDAEEDSAEEAETEDDPEMESKSEEDPSSVVTAEENSEPDLDADELTDGAEASGEAAAPARGGRDRKKEKSPGAEERAFLKWLDENHPAAFVEWRAIDHPDFPGRRVEVGGFAPFAKLHPPPDLAGTLAAKHATWLAGLAERLPRVGILRAEAKALGRGVHEVEVVVENSGRLPTILAHGESTRLVNPTRVELDLPDALILAGERSARLGPLAGSGGAETARWVVHAPGRTSLRVTVVSALGGTAETTVTLKGGR